MQSLEFNDLRVEIFAPHAPSFAPAPSFAKEAVSAPIIYLHALEFDAAGTSEIYELVSRGADFVLAAIYLSEAQWGDKLIVRGQQNRRLRGCAISRAAARRTWKNLRTS